MPGEVIGVARSPKTALTSSTVVGREPDCQIDE
jgi:hypothetical protein